MAVVNKLKELAKMTLPTREGQPPATVTSPPVTAVTRTSGLTAEQLIAELQRQKRSAT